MNLGHTYLPEDLQIVKEAYDKACRHIMAASNDAFYANDQMRNAIAVAVMDLAAEGEDDIDHLATFALERILKRAPEDQIALVTPPAV